MRNAIRSSDWNRPDKGFDVDTFRGRLCRQHTRVRIRPKRSRHWSVAIHRGYYRYAAEVAALTALPPALRDEIACTHTLRFFQLKDESVLTAKS